MAWLEQQKDCDAGKVIILKKLRDSAKAKAIEKSTNKTLFQILVKYVKYT